MKRILLPSLAIVLIPLCLLASYGKSNVLQREIKRSPLIVAPLTTTTPQPQAPPAAPGKGCAKNTFYPFTIHILSSQSLADARRSMERLNASLGKVFITKTDLGATGIWYRLDYGLFSTAKDAVSKMRELQRKGIIDSGAFLGSPTPYTLELVTFDAQSHKQAQQEIGRLKDLGVASYLIEENEGCLRVVVGAFPDMKSAKMVQSDLSKLGLNPTITKR
ncbi:MAG TPA: SPOR domain-containing protein [Deltaproteobacteria bacterium]|nr:SPOR domain-containing protein [Deltaproteobacteria bacterium]